MLDLKFILANQESVREMLNARNSDADLNQIIELAQKRREFLYQFEQKRAEQNKASEAIGRAKKEGKDATDEIAAMKSVAETVKQLQSQTTSVENELNELLLTVPNMPHKSVPIGTSDADNQLVDTYSEPRKFDFEPKAHWELGETLGIIDVELGAKLAGASFATTVGAGAKLERALKNLMLDQANERGYREVSPPYLASTEAMTGTGQLPKFGFDMYRIEDSDLWLIPTGEVPLTNIMSDSILASDKLPYQFTAFTPCFRREAGAAGRDTRGMMRVHQFLKVELVKIVHPETSYDEMDNLLADSVNIMQLLDLPYRVVSLCTGDLGFGATKTYDVEVWLPSEQTYREISSCSNYEAFQARRMNCRFRPGPDEKPEFVHTLNGSALAIGRTIIAILENYQNADGSVTIPKALRQYMGGMERIE